ncbi:MAG: hypothetical protein ACE5DP_00100 [Fidelibacterota bacterium]
MILLYLSLFCLGSWGLLSIFFPAYITEIFLGLLIPWLMGLFTLRTVKRIYETHPEKLTPFMMKAFFGKMVVVALYIILLFRFYTFHALPFVISFAGYFITLHTLEAFYLRSTFNN